MNYIKMLAYVAISLGVTVLIVAVTVTIDRGRLALNPLLLGLAAVAAGFISLKKGKGS